MEGLIGPDGVLVLGERRYRAALGHGGVRSLKQEGDGATPEASLPLRRVLYRADRVARPRSTWPTMPLAPHDGWCDEPGHAEYNRLIRLPNPARHEALWRDDGIYDVIAVLGWNDDPVMPGRGSAIFLHVARPGLAPTDGCIALALPDLLAALEAGLAKLRVTTN